MQTEVRNSDTNSDSHIPLPPNIRGTRMKDGIRNIAPRSKAKIMDGRTFSTLWK